MTLTPQFDIAPNPGSASPPRLAVTAPFAANAESRTDWQALLAAFSLGARLADHVPQAHLASSLQTHMEVATNRAARKTSRATIDPPQAHDVPAARRAKANEIIEAAPPAAGMQAIFSTDRVMPKVPAPALSIVPMPTTYASQPTNADRASKAPATHLPGSHVPSPSVDPEIEPVPTVAAIAPIHTAPQPTSEPRFNHAVSPAPQPVSAAGSSPDSTTANVKALPAEPTPLPASSIAPTVPLPKELHPVPVDTPAEISPAEAPTTSSSVARAPLASSPRTGEPAPVVPLHPAGKLRTDSAQEFAVSPRAQGKDPAASAPPPLAATTPPSPEVRPKSLAGKARSAASAPVTFSARAAAAPDNPHGALPPASASTSLQADPHARGEQPTRVLASGVQPDAFAALDRPDTQPPVTWMHAGIRHAEAGYRDPALGWIGVRAEATGNTLHAAVLPGSPEAAQVIGGQLDGLNQFLAERHGHSAYATLNAPDPNAFSSSGQDTSQRRQQGDPTASQPPLHTAISERSNRPGSPSLPHPHWDFASAGAVHAGSRISVMA